MSPTRLTVSRWVWESTPVINQTILMLQRQAVIRTNQVENAVKESSISNLTTQKVISIKLLKQNNTYNVPLEFVQMFQVYHSMRDLNQPIHAYKELQNLLDGLSFL